GARKHASLGPRAVRSERHRSGGARRRRQRIIRKVDASPAQAAIKVDVKRQSKGPQSYAYNLRGPSQKFYDHQRGNAISSLGPSGTWTPSNLEESKKFGDLKLIARRNPIGGRSKDWLG